MTVFRAARAVLLDSPVSRVGYGYATAVAASSVDATYQICRVPSNAKVKSVILESEAQGAGA